MPDKRAIFNDLVREVQRANSKVREAQDYAQLCHRRVNDAGYSLDLALANLKKLADELVE